jgi:hypothetical protein
LLHLRRQLGARVRARRRLHAAHGSGHRR